MKLGTKVEIVGSSCMSDPVYVGLRGVVVESPPFVHFLDLAAGTSADHLHISVDLGESRVITLCRTAVRPIEDMDRHATWEGIAQVTGWKRPTVKA